MSAVAMPRLSDSMEEGTIIRWLVDQGASVKVGDELVEIETDKATISYEAEAAGTLEIVVGEGQTARVGETIARIGEGARDRAGAKAATGSRAKASPVARRLARARGVELGSLSGTGPDGRIVKRDVEAAAANGAGAAGDGDGDRVAQPEVAASKAADTSTPQGAPDSREFRPLTSVQATIARRMAESKATAPDFALTVEIDMERAIELRSQLAELGAEPPPSLGDLVIRACALALRAHPKVNSSYRDGGLERHGQINIAVAVATPDALFAPTVVDADQKSLTQLAVEVRELSERARAGRLTPPELSGATFTVSNLGMFGIEHFTAVLTPPQAAILAVGASRPRIVAQDGQPAVRHRMNVTLTCDHRVLYGADGAAFLATVRENLEQPLRLIL